MFTLMMMLLLVGCSKDSDPDTGVPVDRSANLLAAGESAADLLTNDEFDALAIEIAYVQGFRPTEAAIDHLRSFLINRTFKTDIRFEYLPLESPGEETLTLQEIAAIETENRTLYNEGSTLGLYIYFADAPNDSDEEEEDIVTLGAVYRNTSMVIHEVTIRNLASRSLLISNADIEMVTLSHEFGHLFGLVNLSTPMQNPHEDPEAEHHCDQADCLMQAQLEFAAGTMSVLESRTGNGHVAIPVMGTECLRDLEAIGGRPAN